MTYISFSSGQGINDTDWVQVSGNENNFSLVIEHNLTGGPLAYEWSLEFVTMESLCAGYRPAAFAPPGTTGDLRFDPVTECTLDVTESVNATPGFLTIDPPFPGGVSSSLRLDIPGDNTGEGPFTYTVEFTCSDEEPEEEPEEEPGPGDGNPFDYQLPVLPTALPDTL
jgi:hypothetical protein